MNNNNRIEGVEYLCFTDINTSQIGSEVTKKILEMRGHHQTVISVKTHFSQTSTMYYIMVELVYTKDI